MNSFLLSFFMLALVNVVHAQTHCSSDSVYTYLDEPARYSGNIDELYQRARLIPYSKDALMMGISGTVEILFEVNCSGKIENARIIRGIGGMLDRAALNFVETMPDWIPAKIKGKSVRFCQLFRFKFNIISGAIARTYQGCIVSEEFKGEVILF